MFGLLEELFGTSGFMPHGHCYLWTPALLWTEVLSNGLIAAAYLTIAGGLAFMVRRVDDMPFGWMYWLFALFIFACGVTHIFDVVVIWEPRYWIDAGIRVVTAVASVGTAILLIPLVPKAVTLIRGARSAMEKGVRLESVVDDLESMYEKTKQLEEQKTRFFANVSHELRTPLTLVLGRARNLLDGDGLDDDQREAVNSIVDNSKLLLKHVDDLLDIARFEAGRLEKDIEQFDIGRLIRRVAGNFDGLADDCEIDYRIEGPEDVDVQMDRAQLESILMNLLSNAFKFTPDGGVIRVEYEVVEESTSYEEHIELAVNDSGPGVPPEQREAIFERFRQEDVAKADEFGGTGLGLVVVQNFVDLHGGDVSVEDAPEGGARFVVRLPTTAGSAEVTEGDLESEDSEPPESRAEEIVADVAVERMADMRRSPAEETSSTEERETRADDEETAEKPSEAERETAPDEEATRVLVVEDNPEMNDFIRDLLAEDFATIAASDGTQALQLLDEHPVDMIITDVMMPEVDGVELVDRLKSDEAYAEIPVLVLTARADQELKTEMLDKGVDDFIPKPFSNRELLARVSNLESVRKTRTVLQTELESRRENIAELASELSEKKSELEKALEETQLARMQAERASEAKTEFLGMVSHELRTPLTALEMQLELLRLKSDALSSEQVEVTEQMQGSLDRLREVVEGLLHRAALESGRIEVEPSTFDVTDLVEQIVEGVRGQAEDKGLEVETTVATDVTRMHTDQGLVRVVVSNLVENAVKFTEEGEVGVDIDRQDDHHAIRVRDTGPGIDVSDQAAVFQAFDRGADPSKQLKPGAGLGLNLVRETIRALGGRLELESTPGEGSTFTVILPTDYSETEQSGGEPESQSS